MTNQTQTNEGNHTMPIKLGVITVCKCALRPHEGQCRKASPKTWASFFAAHGIYSGPMRLS